MKLVVVLATVLLAGSSSADIFDNFSGLTVPCDSCDKAVSTVHDYVSDQTRVDLIIGKVQDVLCAGHFFDDLPVVKNECKNYVHYILAAAKDLIDIIEAQGVFCQQVLQCNNPIDKTTLKAMLLQQGLIFISKLSTYDSTFTNNIFTLITDRQGGSRLFVEKICADALKCENQSLSEKTFFDRICNFVDGDAECSLCEVVTNVVESDVSLLTKTVDGFLMKTCKGYFSNDKCHYIVYDILETVHKMADTSVHYGFFCKKLGYCQNDNIFTRRCQNFHGTSNVVCEFVSILRCTLNSTVCEDMEQEEQALTLEQANEYCTAKVGIATDYLVEVKGDIQKDLMGLCSSLSGEFESACKYLFTTRYEKMIGKVVNFLNDSACCTLGFCLESSSTNVTEKDDTFANLCEVLVNAAYLTLNDPNTEENLKNSVLKLVKEYIHSDIVVNLVKSYFHNLYVLILEQINTKKICGC